MIIILLIGLLLIYFVNLELRRMSQIDHLIALFITSPRKDLKNILKELIIYRSIFTTPKRCKEFNKKILKALEHNQTIPIDIIRDFYVNGKKRK